VQPEESTDPKMKVLAGRYRILRSLGRGGIGKVFLVQDLESGNELALKMLRTKYQDNSKVIARFAREVNAIRQLNHPGIVKIYDAKRDGDLLFYTMEYIEGKSLREWLTERRRLQVDSVVRVLSLLAHALEHAHKITTHRDLSPENVMVMRDGSIRVLDFGLAKLEDSYDGLTMVGVTLGKLSYSAPEQRRSAADVDSRADIYSMGVMFYEMLTGKLPKDRPLKQFRPELPPYFTAFYEKATADDRDARFQTAREFRFALLELWRKHTGESEPDAFREEEGTPVPVVEASSSVDIPPRLRGTSLAGMIRHWFNSLLRRRRR